MRTIGLRRWASAVTTTALLSAVLLSTLGAVGILSASPASASGKTPVLRATPHSRLTNLDAISVRGGSFTAGDVIEVVECQRGAALPIQCDPATLSVPVTVNATGHVPPFSFTVMTGPVGTATCGTSKTDARSCEIAANDVTKASLFVASANIAFKPGSTLPTADRRR